MRQRRHVNGNSNAVASASASDAAWGSGRTVPATLTSATKRVGPPAVVADAATESAVPLKAVKQEKRSGAATARRPQSGALPGSRDLLAPCRPTRRVQSARGATEKVNPRSEAVPEVALQPKHDSSLPKLQPHVGDFTPPEGKHRVLGPRRKPTPPDAASGTDAKSQVQWAVKVVPSSPDQARGPTEPAEMDDLHRLLRDRYGEKRSVRQAFRTWDANKDGRLSADELREMLTRLGFDQALGRKKMESIFQHIATMPAASLQYDDFCGFVYGPPELNQSASNRSCRSSSSRTQPPKDSKADDHVVAASDPDCVVSLLRAKYETRRVHQVFRDWDIDKSGGITLEEIENNLRRQGLRIAKPQLMKLFDTYDLNHDGRLLYDEFMRLVYGPVHEQRYSYLAELRRKKQQERQDDEGDPLSFFRGSAMPQQTTHSTDDPGFRATLQRKLQSFASRLNDAYAAFDDDHNGNLSYRELCQGLQQLGLNLTEREFLHLATRADTDGNGEISFKEFCDVFGGGDGSNRRHRSTPNGEEEDNRIEGQETRGPKGNAENNGQRRKAAGTFNFAHLTRRTKIPTRCGRTTFPSTKELISGNQDEGANSTRFTTESLLYGSGASIRSAHAAPVLATLGQEEKQRRNAANANRLQRLRVQMERYEAQARPLQDSHKVAQERRVRTLQRHQERYHQRIEDQRPRHARSPARKGIQISRSSPTAPFVPT